MYPRAPEPWLDLSTGINPVAWRGVRASVDDLKRLPDPVDLAGLEAAAARAFGVADPARVVAVAGAEAGLRLLPELLRLSSVEILGPTYGGHEDAWRAAGVPIRAGGDGLVVVNPNNPDGRSWPAERLLAEPRWLIVDESFGEAAPTLSLAGVERERLVVLRSFGKFYGLPGVRLGFVIASPDLAGQLRARLGDWPVCADAIAMGRAAYADEAWRTATLTRLQRDAARLDALLTSRGFEVIGGTALFRLAAAPDAQARFQRLCEAGVLTRPFAYEPGWLRFGLPAPHDFERLEAAL
ncbi:aminotransferase class I/II-fold pyridoxal phosphate-dependent enzyme [Caulobacter mirabilis]|nr:aminotransferase class I/II-fold pyridoxal phosphate-dependent enzyme [Caulobacter mirabilis]